MARSHLPIVIPAQAGTQGEAGAVALPMLLVIDCGNTNVVFAVRDDTAWRGIWRVRTDAQRTSDEYGVWLMSLFGHVGLKRDDISAAVIGTVVPAALYNLRRLCRDWFNIEPLIARSTLDWGFDIRVVNPAEVGADRLLNTLAAHQRFDGPLIIVDFGTATTFDVVDKDGAYLGGVICPGINLSLEALHQAAAQLPRIGIARPQAVIGRQTVPAMQSGIYWGYVAMVEGLVARIKAEYGGPMKVIATGGLAPLVAEGTMVIEQIEPDLTLDGLRMLAERNPTPTLPRERARLVEHE
jgi:type III pantothenate kinase